MVRLTPVQIKFIEAENAEQTDDLSPMPKKRWPAHRPGWPYPFKVFRSKRFLVQCYQEKDGIVRISVNRTDIDPATMDFRDEITWDQLQEIKAQAGYAWKWASEIYPPEADIVNVANMRHLWVLPVAPDYGWKKHG